jgi:uncharacterized protein
MNQSLAIATLATKLRWSGLHALQEPFMKQTSLIARGRIWFALALLLSFGFAMAQSEPSINQIYATAQAGKLDEAQVMVQQVLITHPKSPKAHFVQSELYSRQGNLPRAREALAQAESLAPGLPFAKPEAVQALRAQLAARSAPVTPRRAVMQENAPATGASSFSWGLPLLLAGGVIFLGYLMFRRRPPAVYQQEPIFAPQNGLSGPQSFGMGGGTMQPAYGQPGYGQPGYGQAPGTGLGGRIMGGVATGLAVGAGVMAAEAIGRNLMGHNNQNASGLDNANRNSEPVFDRNSDMGGQNFGLNDSSSWDDGGSVDVGGGGDWDN